MLGDYKAEEVVCFTLKELSKGNSVCIGSFSEFYGVSKETLRKRFREVVGRYYKDDVYYDSSSKCWYANRSNFLETSFIQPEEAVILNGILRNSDHFGSGLSSKVHLMVNHYIKRGHLASLQPEIIENIEHMREHFALLENAIKNRRKVILHYVNSDVKKSKIFLPLRIVNMEYYWYAVGEIETEDIKEIRYFRIKKIIEIETLDKYVTYSEFRTLYNKVKNIDKGMNAFYQPYKETKKIRVIIPEWFEEHIHDIPYFNTWENLGKAKKIEGTQYLTYHVISTDEEYRDIIPTIQKYMPHIVICNNEENEEIIKIMRQRSEEYARIFESSVN